MRQKYVEIRLTKCRLFLTEPELQNLLSLNPLLWKEGIRRGKYILRARAAKGRQAGGKQAEELPWNLKGGMR
ncbi:MAG: hypothetical protein A4E52_00436 [Pelotomaculum sp. PtaB.Bin013]|uniref:Uncharacterized protein n=1 Tax=Pelotomaculum isophthalicicum JI TaxID=947010 RepID=A0A9X4H1M4_9FIRM|nr:hypothetical protein [Pelotomaculum isophthalicicum]MDF9408271.1 hypothetical protein [Pelotomaculum isophthalicicum JI]OPX91617.1 MAG: hypothetical protein A4E52_00436 [Pelotomaculum sp. PtaB.Bin013]